MSNRLTADDRLEIRQALTLWGRYEDEGRSEEWAALFTPDGQCTYGDGRVIAGREKLEQASRERWAKPVAKRCIHWMGDAVITGTGERADVVHYCMVLEQSDTGIGIKAVSRRSYVFVRHEGAWLIERRAYQALPETEWPRAHP